MSATAYSPAPGVFPGRPPCATCGAALRLHTLPPDSIEYDTPLPGGTMYLTGRGLQALFERGAQLLCPEPWRPDTIEQAHEQHERALASGDANRIFVARGNLQRLGVRLPKVP